MNVLPLDVGVIHFVGIGGIGMSGIAEILKNLGYQVQGSDLSANPNVERLRALSIPIAIGHAAENVDRASVVVISSAVKDDNVEVAAARKARLPIVRRAEMLGELMRLKWSIAVAGTHGKTTTTSLIAALMDAAEFDPTVINGGVIEAYGGNAKLGAGDWMVVESDESDGSFLRLPATIGVVTNIDPEHLEHWGDFDALKEGFTEFVERLPFYGFAALCVDHPEVQKLAARVSNKRVVTYGFSPQADVRAEEPRFDEDGSLFDVVVTARDGATKRIEGLRCAIPGRHNVQNALAAIAIARELDLDDDALRRAFAAYEGVRRRFTKTGVVDGVAIIDDYGHHPVEIAAVLRTAREAYRGRVLAVCQPHRYTRLQSLFDDFCTCFGDADTALIAPVYEAGERPIAGVDHAALAAGVAAHGHRDARAIPGPEAIAPLVAAEARPGDVVVLLGAGSITAWARALPNALREDAA